MTASFGETHQPPKYSCGDCERDWTVERRTQTVAVTEERRASVLREPHALATVNDALEAFQKAFRVGDDTPSNRRTRQRRQS